MPLENVLRKAVKAIKSGMLDNEAQVKQAVILPILRELGYDDTDPEQFVPEFSVGDGWVDYAIRHHGKPQVFIEAKRLGNLAGGGEEQVFRYAAHRGVPFLILTDGAVWSFYLSMAAGPPADRRFYQVNLRSEEHIPRYAEFFNKYLGKTAVFSGSARRDAEKLHESVVAREHARASIPRVWQQLLSTLDERLSDLLVEAVENDCGTKPELDYVEDFLRNQISSDNRQHASDAVVHPPVPAPVRQDHANAEASRRQQTIRRIVGFELDGTEYTTGKSILTLIKILNVFQERDASFMERFAPQTVGRIRPLVARDLEALYPGNTDSQAQCVAPLDDGWLLGTNYSTSGIERFIRTACEVAGVRFDRQLRLIKKS